MERETNTHIFFWGGEFSNWYPCKFRYQHLVFFNSEQAFMWEKAVYFGDMKITKEILETSSPKIAKELGRQVKNFSATKWSEVSYERMIDVNMAKFSQNFGLRRLLLDTDPKILVEASPTDSIWGIGLHWSDDRVLDESLWQGKNLLGKALMDVRLNIKFESSL